MREILIEMKLLCLKKNIIIRYKNNLSILKWKINRVVEVNESESVAENESF